PAPKNSSSSSAPTKPSPPPSAPPEQAAATPPSPTDSTPDDDPISCKRVANALPPETHTFTAVGRRPCVRRRCTTIRLAIDSPIPNQSPPHEQPEICVF